MAKRRIVITGGPGSGKTTVWRALSERHPERIAPVPEVATLLFREAFPTVETQAERYAVQRAIYALQRELECFHEARTRTDQILLCDRGTCDGAAYWPDGGEAFFTALGTRHDNELARYDAVLFLETAAVGGYAIHEGNETRTESLAQAVALDRNLHALWTPHPRLCHIPHQPDFAHKIREASAALRAYL